MKGHTMIKDRKRYGLEEAAQLIGIAHSTLRTQVHKQRIEAHRIKPPIGAPYVVIYGGEIKRYIAEQKGRPGVKAATL